MMTVYRRLALLLCCLLLLAAFPLVKAPCPADAADAWTVMAYYPSNSFLAVWGSSCSDVFVSGESGTILHYNGSSWSSMASGTSQRLTGLWGSSGSDVFCVGPGGTILHYNGSAWSSMTSGTSRPLARVWGTSGSDVFVVGDVGTILHYNGSAWSSMTSGTSEFLQDVWGSSGSDVFVIGTDGTILHYNGSTWSPMASGTHQTLGGIWGSSGSDVFVGSNSNFILHYNGTAWFPTLFGTAIPCVSMWGNSASDVYAAGTNILHYSNGTWNDMTVPVSGIWLGIWGSSGQDIFAVGHPGYILHYGTGCRGATSAAINTTLGVVNLNTGAGYISNAGWTAPGGTRCSNPSGYYFPYGMFGFNITNLTAGQQAAITIRFPNPLPLGTRYYKCINGRMVDCSSLVTRVNEYTLILTLTDGGLGDADGAANGIIVDPGGPAFPFNNAPQSSSPTTSTTPQKPVSLSNISVKSASLSATKVTPGTPVTVTADLANTGTGNGTSVVKVYVNGAEESQQGVSVNSGGTSTVTFDVSRNEPGTYTVYVGGTQAGSFTVDQFTPETILYISGALVFFALVIGVIFMTRRRV